MSKAIEGAAMLAGAVGMGVAAFFNPALIASPWFDKVWEGLILGGISMELGAIGDALTSNRGQNITTRQAASYRQIIYGTQRVGGVEIYRSTTGSTHNQFNYVIVIATHECYAIESLYLDGRKVYFNAGSGGYSVRNGYGFGGSADGNDYTGPNGQQYNFGGKVYCEARYGTQLPGDVIGGLTANDPKWTGTSAGTPYVGGCTYVYLKVEYDTSTFPGEPEIRFTVHGKPIYDPRTSTTSYSSNWALIVNDMLTDTKFGVGDPTVNQAQLIAAANVCDEQVDLAAGGTESRYACHWHYDTSTSPGDAINNVMSAAAGRLSRIGGEWYIWPAYFQGPSASFDASHLTNAIQWNPTRSYRDLFNRVTGTYVAPNYPYNAGGNLYDSNGWYNGTIQNNFPFAFQQTNYPEYACDALHGYPADEFLTEDGGIQLPREIGQQCVLSVAQAQRVAKIYLLRNRQQGTGSFEMSLAAYQIQPCDTFNFTFAANGWANKLLEVSAVSFKMDRSARGQAPLLKLMVGVNETAASVYEWSVAEELTVYDVPAALSQVPSTPAPPTNMTLHSSAATATQQPDGTVVPRIQVLWDTPLDAYVRQIQMQYQLAGTSTWLDAGSVDVSLNAGYITGIIAGQSYNVRIRSVRAGGAASVWVEQDGFATGIVLSTLSLSGVGIGSLAGEAYSDGTAAIVCNLFTATVGTVSVSVTPTPNIDTGLNQGQLYWVYYVDLSFVGGSVAAIATQDQSDFRGKLGYYLIDSIVTPTSPTSGGGGGGGGGTPGTRIAPSSSHDVGTRSSFLADSAYDGDSSTAAQVIGNSRAGAEVVGDPDFPIRSSYGQVIYDGFPGSTLTRDATLTIVCAVTGANGVASVDIGWTGGGDTPFSSGSATATGTYTTTVPSGTAVNSLTVTCTATAIDPSIPSTTNQIGLQIYEIYLDT